jgi:hypothetical protein
MHISILRYGLVVDYYAFGCVLVLRVRSGRCGDLSKAQPRDWCIKQKRVLFRTT